MDSVKLVDICRIEKGQQIETSRLNDAHRYRYINGGVKESGYYDSFNSNEECVLVSEGGASCGYVNYINEPFWCGCHCYRLFDFKVMPKYLYYALKANQERIMDLRTGVCMPNIKKKEFQNFVVSIDRDAKRQDAVAKVLDTIQKAIDLKRKQLEDLDELVKSKFQEMFGDPLENEKRWAVLPLSSIGSIARGVSKHRPRNAPELLGDYMPFIQTGDIANSGMYISNCQSGYSELGVEQSKIWHKGTLCITIAANIGKCAIMTFDACFPDSVVGFIANPSIVKVEYVYFYFLWIQQALEDNAIGVAQKNINLGVLNNMNIPVPPIEQQNSFVEYVKKADAANAIIKQENSDLEELMDSKMDEYFG